MLSKEEINKKIEDLSETVKGIKAEEEKNISNELKVVLAGSELQLITLQSTVNVKEEKIRSLVKKFEDRAAELQLNYENASLNEDLVEKRKLQAMIWTNDIRLDTLKWILEEQNEEL
ncbi:MAG: hypothetical protein MJ232_08650 [archaeon]|nr:hypothetical protein [archaeon]